MRLSTRAYSGRGSAVIGGMLRSREICPLVGIDGPCVAELLIRLTLIHAPYLFNTANPLWELAC
ncbi:hypothetical protein D3C75_1348130 [compost metagenome]